MGTNEFLGASNHKFIQCNPLSCEGMIWLVIQLIIQLHKIFYITLLNFLILGLVVLHIWALHVPGNNNPVGIDIKPSKDTVPFLYCD